MEIQNKGSEWKKWDLHFHSPSSYDYGNKNVTNNEIISVLHSQNISVVAITDHHVIDIERIKDLQNLGKQYGITVLPGIEFLSDAKGKEPIHFIGIFAEDCHLEYIWGQIENLTAIKDVKGSGKKLNEVYCDLTETIKLVKKLGGITTIHAGEKHGSIENITNSLPHTIAQKIDIALIIDIYELGKASDQTGYKEKVFPAIGRTIPMIICSDNHNINKYVSSIKENLWIKGSTTFNGLRYALNEPSDRFFIGDTPPILKRVKEEKTKYIKSIEIKRNGEDDPKNIWFDSVNIPVNSELVAIIGNKGSGKSAISDIISMCADADHSDDFLFLHKTKFKKKGFADRFSATLEFESGEKIGPRSLDYNISTTDQCRVRYLPQSYFEKVCNEIGKIEAFRIEIEKVVFQYVPNDQRLGKENFQDLINFKKEKINKEIEYLLSKIKSINEKTIYLEDKSNPDYRQSILSKISLKKAELVAHESTKPIEKKDPSLNITDPSVINKRNELSDWNEKLNNEKEKVAASTIEINQSAVKIENLTSLKRELQGKVNELRNLINEFDETAKNYGIELSNVIKIEFDASDIDSVKNSIEERRNQLILDVSEDLYLEDGRTYQQFNSAMKIRYCTKQIEIIQADFGGAQKEYQQYLNTLSQWVEKKENIVGSEEKIDSLKFLQGELNFLDKDLEKDLVDFRKRRVDLTIEIFSKKNEVKYFYDEIKHDIASKLLSSNDSGLSIASTLTVANDLSSTLLGYIQQNKIGSFYGNDNGKNLLNELIFATNWNDENSLRKFLIEIIDYLDYDKRNKNSNNHEKTFIGNLIRNRKEFYERLFSLSYIESHYVLQQNGKNLEQLSPGEKGALLLVFYLVLDKEDIPLIIDQPEDNLDNLSVANILVPYIQEAKKKRQIIIVTHNPNLAVVSDAEQIIKVSINKENGNKFSFVSGGIDDLEINKAVIEVLEGTIPAFTKRKDKYSGITS